jgi:hypothetical protein
VKIIIKVEKIYQNHKQARVKNAVKLFIRKLISADATCAGES